MTNEVKMSDPSDDLIIQLLEMLEEQHELIKFLYNELPENEQYALLINSALERIGQKIKGIKDTRIVTRRWIQESQ